MRTAPLISPPADRQPVVVEGDVALTEFRSAVPLMASAGTSGPRFALTAMLQSVQSFSISIIVHVAAVLIVGGWATQNQIAQFKPNLMASVGVSEEEPELLDFLTQQLSVVSQPIPTAVLPEESGATNLGRLPEMLESHDGAVASSQSNWPPVDLGAMLGEIGRGTGKSGEAHGAGAEFFGVKAYGKRFVFVVDRSISMKGDKFDEARQEVYEAVRRLGPDKEFYVIFFAGDSLPMFSKVEPQQGFLPATEENIAQLDPWLWSMGLRSWTDPYEALTIAMRLKPDAVYLLTDGEFTAPGTRESVLRQRIEKYLKKANRPELTDGDRHWPTIVHTIGFYTTNARGAAALKAIAAQNGGTYQFVTREKWVQASARPAK
jgi:hypothetical protein